MCSARLRCGAFGDDAREEDAGILLKSNRNRIEANDLRDVLFGIYIFHAERNAVLDNRIRGRAHLDLGERGSGVHIWNSNYNTIKGNTITDVRDGFYIQNASYLCIEGNAAFNVRYGVLYRVLDQLVNGSLAKVLLQSTEPERFHS